MLLLRSLLFNIAFYVNLVVWLIAIIPTFVLPRKALLRAAQGWGHSNLWLLRTIAGTRVEFRGLEKIPPGGLVVAAKHQSFLDTFALVTLFDDPTFILKRELTFIPFFGWYLVKARMVPIDRRSGSAALTEMNERAREAVKEGRQILIFPEGTRRAAGAAPAYKYGVAHLYANLGVPCLPVALNAGLYWPRRRFIRRPGTIVIEVLDPIEPGMPRDRFFKELQERIETACDQLLKEGEAELGLAPIRDEAAATVE